MIQIISQKISQQELYQFCMAYFKTFVKFVADIRLNVLAAGGELHTDAETLLLQNGSRQSDLWGGNFFPWKDVPGRLEYTSFINIRPRDNNTNMEVMDTAVRSHIRALCEQLLLSDSETMSTAEPSE